MRIDRKGGGEGKTSGDVLPEIGPRPFLSLIRSFLVNRDGRKRQKISRLVVRGQA